MASKARERARQHKLKRLADKRLNYPNTVIGYWKEAMRERIEQTRKLAGFKVRRGDCHSHSTYSDGIGTVPEIAGWVEQAGLGFFFQRCVSLFQHDAGFEDADPRPSVNGFDLIHEFQAQHDLVKDYNAVIALGAFPFIPHPKGWFPNRRYTKKQINALNLLGDDFTMELINGANNIFDCFDITDEWAVALWDEHLCQGKTVRGMGNTDAHLPQAIGDVWNGVFVDRLTKNNVLASLWAGHFFASDAPFVNLMCGRSQLGDVLTRKKGASVEVRYECVASLGLQRVRVVADGKVVRDLWPTHDQIVKGSYKMRFRGGNSYIRVECFARDTRKAFANPIYIRE